MELRIIEGPSIETGKDITFDYNANFFLYASLEHARPIAHGRVQTASATNPPILTGVPASGMAYLDRPTEAGYFIFPDLSVRHEGRYRLSFSLFETTKEEKDFDLEPPEGDLPPGVDWRMEIKTLPFSVYSAKKFPGLMESTQLSKTVADQGCRVRIRRDVRMRKRDGKSGGGNGGGSGNSGYERREEEYARRRTATPAEDPLGIRARSLSNSSEHRNPYPDPQRRPSVVESYPPPPPPPPSTYEPSSAGSRHLSFGEPTAPQYPAPPRQYSQPNVQLTPVSPTGPYPPPSQSPYSKPEPAGYIKTEPSSYAYPSRNLPQMYPSSSAPTKPQDAYERRPSNSTYVPPSPSVYSAVDSHSRRESHQSYPPTPISAQPRPQPQPPTTLAPLKICNLMSPLPPIEAQTEPTYEPPSIATGGKRKHDSVFSQSTRPLHNGQRQQDPHYNAGRRGITPEPFSGTYNRADGNIGVVNFSKFHS